MFRSIKIAAIALLCGSLFAQSRIQPNPNRPWRFGTTLPATCGVSDAYFLTSGTVGLYECTAPNVWTAGGPIALADTPLTTRGDLLTVNSNPALSRLAAGASTTVLHGGTDLSFGAVNLASEVTGQLPISSVGSSGLSATAPATISAAGLIANGLASVTNDAQTKASVMPNTAPGAGQVPCGNAGGTAYAPCTISGSGATISLASTGVETISSIANASLSNSTIQVNTTAPITGGATPALGGSVTIACATCSTITNAAGSNVIPKSNGTNFVASSLSDDGTTVSTAEVAKFSGVAVGGATPAANTFTGVSGAPFVASGNQIAVLNSTSFELSQNLIFDSSKLITQYNGIATVDGGVPSEVGVSGRDQTGLTAALSATTICTPSATGRFRISVYEKVTTAASVSSILGGATGTVLTYTDGTDSVAQSITMGLDSQGGTVTLTNSGNSTTTSLNGSSFIYAKTAIAIQLAVGYTSSGTAMAYQVRATCEAL